jgi:acetyl esterase/lipase
MNDLSLASDQVLHPQVAEMVRQSRAAQHKHPVSHDAAQLRRGKRQRMATLGPGPGMAAVRDVEIEGNENSVPARIYVPRGVKEGVLVYCHGGGWVTGTLDDYDVVCRALADASSARVVSVDYRLAPEHPFPAALHDALAAIRWISKNLAGNESLVILGDSAGGNLAAVAARELVPGEVDIALQVLVCPVLDHDFATESYQQFGEGFVLSRDDMEWYWDQYVPDRSLRDNPLASPLRASDLDGLPPALIVLAGFDPLLDEGLTYATILEEAGVPSRVVMFRDVVHGFFPMATRLDRADQAVRLIGASVRDVCGSGRNSRSQP